MLIDSNGDSLSAGYYVGTLEAGTRMLDGEYLFHAYAPTGKGKKAEFKAEAKRLNHKRRGEPCKFRVAPFEPKRKPQKGSVEEQVLALGAVVLDEADHNEALQELATRKADA